MPEIASKFSNSSKISSILLYIIPLFSDITYYLFSYCCCPRTSPRTCYVSCSAHTAFSLMLCATRPTGSDRHTHSRQCFLTTEASQLSVGISEEAARCKIFQAKSSVQFLISDKSLMKSVLPFVRRFSTPALFHMTILISCSAKHPPRTVLESVYLGEHRL